MESKTGNLPTVYLRSCLGQGLQSGRDSYQPPPEQCWRAHTMCILPSTGAHRAQLPGNSGLSECFKWVKLHESIHLELWYPLWGDWLG